MHATRSRAMLVALAVLTGAAAPAMAQSMANDKAMADKNMASDKMMMSPKGTFAGSKDHSASGSYTITGSGKDRALALSDNFKVDKAPDIYVILSKGAMARDAGSVNLGKLRKLEGAQSYKIPESTDLSAYDTVLLWCKKYSVLIGQAPLAGAMDHGTMGSMDHGAMDQPAMAKDTGMMKKP